MRWGDIASADGQLAPDHRSASRLVDLDPYGGQTEALVLGRAEVDSRPISGPCVIEEVAATTLVLPGQAVWRDELGSLVIAEQP
jgi:N-methylhydantoinase A